MKKIILKSIRWYQKILSPDHGWFRSMKPVGHCRYYPTCSEYAYRSIGKNTLFKGVLATIWRVIRCNPLSSGGYDPPK